MRTPGRGFFTAGASAFTVVGLMHISAHVQGRPPGAEAAHDAMVAFTVTLVGLTWSIADAFDVTSLSFAVLSIALGALDLYVLRALRPSGSVLAGLAGVNALAAASLVAIAATRSVAPPLVLYALVALLFAVAALRARATA